MTGIWKTEANKYQDLRPSLDPTAQARGRPEICQQIVKFSEGVLIYGQLAMGCTPHVKEAYKSKMKNVKEQAKRYEDARNWYLKQFKPEVKTLQTDQTKLQTVIQQKNAEIERRKQVVEQKLEKFRMIQRSLMGQNDLNDIRVRLNKLDRLLDERNVKPGLQDIAQKAKFIDEHD